MLTDSHSHLYLEEFNNDINAVIQNAIREKVSRFLLPNIDNTTLPELLALCNNYPENCFPMIGLHPCYVTKQYQNQLSQLHQNIKKNNFIAIGEVGIDLYREKSLINEQKAAFQIQIDWAKKYNLPIVIHSRNSFDEIYNILQKKENHQVHGVFHCFSGTSEQAKKIIDLGFYLGIGGILTFKNSHLCALLSEIDIKHIVLETDSPYLTPHPMRGHRNEPKFLNLVATKLAEIKKLSVNYIAEVTSQNIENIFFKKIKQ